MGQRPMLRRALVSLAAVVLAWPWSATSDTPGQVVDETVERVTDADPPAGQPDEPQLPRAATMPPAAAGEDPREPVGPAVPPPDLFYVEDETGRLVPVPGFGYGDFIDMVRIRQGLPATAKPPALVLESLTVTLDVPATGDVVDCRAAIDATVRRTRAGWAGLPIDLRGLVLDAPPVHDGPGTAILGADPVDLGAAIEGAAGRDDGTAPLLRGYRGWFDGPADGRHRLRLEGRLPLEADGEQRAVRLHLPAATASAVIVRSSLPAPVVVVTPGGVEPRIEADGTGGSIVTCVGLGGTVRIAIGARGTASTAPTAAPEAIVESLARIDGRVIAWQTTVALRDLPVACRTVTVTLPPRATARTIRGGTVVGRDRTPPADGGPPSADAVERLTVEVTRGPDGRAVLDIDAERSIEQPSGSIEALGFMVDEVLPWRQHGRVSLLVEGDWQVEWDDAGANRRVDPPASARRPGLSAAFAYDVQPARLPIRVRPRGSRVVVEPEYRYTVEATRVALDARLRIAVRGAPVGRMVVRLEGWSLEDVSPAGLVDTAAIRSDGPLLIVPFVQPLAGDATIEIRCERPLDREARRLAWQLPVPEADLVAPAAVSVSSAADIEVVPDTVAIRGLVRQTVPSSRLDDGERAVIAYRLDGSDGEFVADRRFLAQRVEAVVAATATVGGDVAVIDETIRYAVAHVPLESVDLIVPAAVVDGGTLELRQGGQPLNPFPVPMAAPPVAVFPSFGSRATAARAEAAAADSVTLRALLPQPLLGAGELTVRYEWPVPAVPAEATSAVELPVVLPAEGRITRQSLALVVDGPLVVDVRGDDWQRDALQAAGARVWTSARPRAKVPLAVSARQGTTSGDTVVEAAWLETRLLAGGREDTCSYVVSSSSRRFELTVPEGWRPTAERKPVVDIRVDGRPVTPPIRADGRVTIELPLSGGEPTLRAAWLVSLECRRDRTATAASARAGLIGWVGPLALDAPRPAPGVVERRFYWEVRVLSDEHVVRPPSRWTSQQRWVWNGLGFERRPVVSRAALARWLAANRGAIGDVASDADEAGMTPAVAAIDPPLAERRAVWSGVGTIEPATVWLVPTWLLVLLASGPMLAAGLGAVYLPTMRQPATVVGCAALAVTAAAFSPDMAPLVVQASLPGAALAALAALLRRFVEPEPREAAAGRPSIIVSPHSSTRLVVGGDSGRAPATESASIAGRLAP